MKLETHNMKHKTQNLKCFMLHAPRFMILILLFCVALNFIMVPSALAADPPAPAPTPIADTSNIIEKAGAIKSGGVLLWGMNMILTGVLVFMSRFIAVASYFFDSALAYNNLGFLNNISAIGTGWEISRNVANIFFIIILLIIAIATILRVQSYNAKQLLPKLIVIALLINFSLSIGFVIIDASNILGKAFYEKVAPNGDVGAYLMRGTAFNQIFNTDEAKNVKNVAPSFTSGLGGILGASAIAGGTCVIVSGGWCAVALALGSLFVGGQYTFQYLSNLGDIKNGINYFYIVIIPIIYGFPLIWVLIVGGILLIIRVAILTLLLVLAPIAFIGYILPTTENRLWHAWWEKFLNHSFFLPAFMFLLYISILIINQMGTSISVGAVQDVNSPFLINMATAVILLLCSLLIAKQMGIYFAESVIKGATTARKWLTGFVGGVAARNLVAPIGARLQQTKAIGRITEASPTLGYYARLGTGWLAGLGKAPAQAENMARAALAQSKGTWGTSFGKLGRAGKEAMLKNMDEKTRGEFLATLPPALRTTADNIIASPQFISKEAKDYNKARMQYEINQEQLKGNLGPFMSGLGEKEMPKYFGAMTEGQKVALLEEWNKTPDAERPALLNKFATMTKAKTTPEEEGLSLEDSEKFRQALKSASGPAVSAYVDKLIGDAKEKTVKALSPSQLAYMYTEGNDAKRTELNGLTKTLAPDVQQQYNDAAAKMLNQKPSSDIIKTLPSLSPDMTAAFIRSRQVDSNIALINDPTMTEPVKKKLMESIKTKGLSDQYAKKLDPLTKVKYLDYAKPEEADIDNTAREKFADLVSVEIKGRTAKELSQSISPKIMTEEVFKKALMKGASIQQLISMTDTVAKAEAVKNILFEATDKDFSADNLAKKLKDKFNNEILGQQLKDMREKSMEKMSPIERAFYKQIFG